MSRSRRKTPIFGFGGNSEKDDKKRWHSRFRHNSKQLLKKNYDDDGFVNPVEREHSDTWAMGKDGKGYFQDATEKDMRK